MFFPGARRTRAANDVRRPAYNVRKPAYIARRAAYKARWRTDDARGAAINVRQPTYNVRRAANNASRHAHGVHRAPAALAGVVARRFRDAQRARFRLIASRCTVSTRRSGSSISIRSPLRKPSRSAGV